MNRQRAFQAVRALIFLFIFSSFIPIKAPELSVLTFFAALFCCCRPRRVVQPLTSPENPEFGPFRAHYYVGPRDSDHTMPRWAFPPAGEVLVFHGRVFTAQARPFRRRSQVTPSVQSADQPSQIIEQDQGPVNVSLSGLSVLSVDLSSVAQRGPVFINPPVLMPESITYPGAVSPRNRTPESTGWLANSQEVASQDGGLPVAMPRSRPPSRERRVKNPLAPIRPSGPQARVALEPVRAATAPQPPVILLTPPQIPTVIWPVQLKQGRRQR